MGYKILWTKLALADLNEIGAYIAEENPDAAVKVGREIINHVKILENFPFVGTFFPRYSQTRAREILCLKYRIFYRINEKKDVVEILRVWHGSRDEPGRKDLLH